jgi:hypothetical protein
MTEEYLGQVVALLAKVQDKTGNWFDLPESLSQEEYQDLLLAEKPGRGSGGRDLVGMALRGQGL